MTDQSIEKKIQEKGKTAARVTPGALQDNIAAVTYFTAANGVQGAACATSPDAKVSEVVWEDGTPADAALNLLTFCVIVLRNGFTVTGESACASPENFDAEIGREIALQNAEQKIWPLMGYALKEKLSAA